ncbi:hypothetical protein BSK66_29355 [Paenibacillus odorifer]|uniref:Uncharacterized protein n=1 Tax=Paenibacillus odorifer TaxID=189426 RepID=A0A1R0X3I6_9BACL|nr:MULTISPECIES: hypothetical protein [Paenibacillus]ETT67432.1 hypothetical protein C171_03515 [Paenibacillus sp. FSL H8-237]OMD27892.1 hypothetical protein BJP51_01925 [Paenibacillus odorifer]OME47975.1 hypothetical protein BSK66_29355 [Paenibacillus odorifer]
MFEIDEMKLDFLNQFTKSYPEVDFLLCEISKIIYSTRARTVSLPKIIDSDEVFIAIQEDILIQTSDGLSFIDNQYFLYFLAKGLISLRFEELWPQTEVFWNEIESLHDEYVWFVELKGIEIMLLILFDRQYGINILGSIIPIIESGKSERNHWELLMLTAEVLPYLHLDSKLIIEFLERLPNSQIPFANVLVKGVELLSKKRPEVGHEIWGIWTSKPTFEGIWLLKAVAIGLAQKESIRSIYPTVLDLLSSDQEELLSVGISICGLFSYEDTTEDLLNNTIEILDSLLQNEFRIELRQVLAEAYGRLVTKSKIAQTAVRTLSTEPIPEIQAQIAYILFMHTDQYMQEDWFQEALLNLSSVKTVHKGIIENLDYVLNKLCPIHLDVVQSFLENWIQQHDKSVKEENIADLFNRLMLTLLNNHKMWFEKLLTSWFLREDIKFHLHIQEIVHYLAVHGNIIHLDQDLLSNLSFKDIKYIVLKILGFVRDNRNLCHLTFSVLLRIPEDFKVDMLVRSAFKDYIAYNYPGATREIITDKMENGTDKERKIARDILEDLDRYQQARSDLPMIKEFFPPEGRAGKFERMQSKQMSLQIEEGSNKKSILLQLAHRVVLKGGRSSFSRVQGKISDRTELSEFSVEMEFPKGEYLDPTGEAMKRSEWRICRREDIE